MSLKFGYIRGIRGPHIINGIKEQMHSFGCENSKIILEEAGEGHPELKKMVSSLKSGDTLVVLSLANLSTSLILIVNLMKTLYSRNVRFISIEDNLDTADEISLRWLKALGDHQYKTRRAGYDHMPSQNKSSRSSIVSYLTKEAKVSYIIELYNAHRPVKEIISLAQVSKATIFRILEQNDISTDRKTKPQADFPNYGGDTES